MFFIGNKSKRIKKKTGKHNKYSDDNIRRTCKHIILNNLLDFINNKIKEIYNNNIGSKKYIKQLLIMNQKQKCNSTSKFNKNLIIKLINEEDAKKKDIFS